jgi:hypothetical protein
MKTCSRCGEAKPLEEFHLSTQRGTQAWCKPCRKAYDHDYFAARRDIRREQKRKLRAELVAWVRGLKGEPCADCGRRFHPAAMHFDHRPGEDKKFEIGFGVRRYSRKRLLTEIAKCDLVCANCHAVRTYRRIVGA